MSDEPASTTPPKRGIVRFLPIALIAVGLALFLAFDLDRFVSLDALRDNSEMLRQFAADNGILAMVGFAIVYAITITVVPPSGAVMTLSSGFMFGWLYGGISTVFGATLGATALFLAARTAFGDVLRERAGPAVQKMRDGFERNAVSYMLFLRLVPAFPFFVVNLAPAFLGVSLRVYVLTTFFGIIPGTFVYASLGAGLGDLIGEESIDLGLIFEPRYLLPILGLAILALVPVAINKVRERSQG